MMKNSLPPRKDIPSFWRPDAPGITYLHLGENPFPPTERVLAAMQNAARNANRYPDTNCVALREKITDYVGHGIEPGNIIVGNGSDELIDLAVLTFAGSKKSVITFEPSFFVYSFTAQRHGAPVTVVPRNADYTLPETGKLKASLDFDSPSLTFIANPNNPTGTLTPRERLEAYIQAQSGIVVVDECYYEYSGETLADTIREYDNLIVFRSLSKSFGLSGLRVGYAVAGESLIERMERHAMTFPVNIIAQAAGLAVLEDIDAYHQRIRELIHARDAMKRQFEELGLKVLPSHTNFLLVFWPEETGQESPAKRLAENGILVSDQTAAMNNGRPAIRIAVGTQEENERLIDRVRESI